MYEFSSYNQFDWFNSMKKVYDIFVDDNGRLKYNKYKEFKATLGRLITKNEQTFKEVHGLKSEDVMPFRHLINCYNETFKISDHMHSLF